MVEEYLIKIIAVSTLVLLSGLDFSDWLIFFKEEELTRTKSLCLRPSFYHRRRGGEILAKVEYFKARDIMGEKLPHAEPNDTVSDVIGLMVKHNLEEVPIVKDDQVVGVLSDTLFIERRNLSFSTKLKNVVHRGPTVDEDDSIIDVSELLLSSDYQGVPVTSKSGTYIGFVTRKNLTEVISELDELKKNNGKRIYDPFTRNYPKS